MESKLIRDILLKHLKGGEAFLPLEEVVLKIDFTRAGERLLGLPYSAWELLYHIRYAQRDILNFCTGENYNTPDWPADYWPEKQAPSNREEWENTFSTFLKERDQLAALATNPEKLTMVVKHGEHQTLFRELLLVIEHTAYHTGQLMILARLLKH